MIKILLCISKLNSPELLVIVTFCLQVINYNYLYSLNAWLLLNPWWLCFDWSMGCVPLITRLSDLRLIAVLVFLIVLSFLVMSATNQEESTEQRQDVNNIFIAWGRIWRLLVDVNVKIRTYESFPFIDVW